MVYHNDVGRHSAFSIATELWVGRFGDRIPVGTSFSAPVQTGPGASQLPMPCVRCHSQR